MTQIPDRWHDLGEFIREQRSNARLSLRKLSELAGISNPYLSQIERGLRKPSAEILQQIAKALRISAETLYVRAGILEERDENDDLEGDILRDRFLTEEQKQMLIQVYRAFRHENEDKSIQPAVAAPPAASPAEASSTTPALTAVEPGEEETAAG